jgi:hypothetical protein
VAERVRMGSNKCAAIRHSVIGKTHPFQVDLTGVGQFTPGVGRRVFIPSVGILGERSDCSGAL